MGERNQLEKTAALCRADSTADACGLLISGADSINIIGINAARCRKNRSGRPRLHPPAAAECSLPISSTSTLTVEYCINNPYEKACSSLTIATCVKRPNLRGCREISTFFTAFADVVAEQLETCSAGDGETAYSNKDCRRIPENLTNLIIRCREKSHANYDEAHCADIRPQITACEAVDDPFNLTAVADAGGVSCRNVAFDNILTQHRDECETNFAGGNRNLANCKRIHALTCVAGGTERWTNINSPLCLLRDGRRSYYREIAFCDLPTTSPDHLDCRSVPRNWQTWFDSATTDNTLSGAIGATVNSWMTNVGTAVSPKPSGFLTLPVGSNTIDFSNFTDSLTHTLTLDSTRVNVGEGGNVSDNGFSHRTGDSTGTGSVHHLQGDALDGIIFGRAYRNNERILANRRFYAAILPTTDLGGPVDTIGSASWAGSMSYLRNGANITEGIGTGAHLNTVNRAFTLYVNFDTRIASGYIHINNNVLTDNAEVLVLDMNYSKAGIVTGRVHLGQGPLQGDATDGYRLNGDGAGPITGIIGNLGAVGVFYHDGAGAPSNLVGGFVACPTTSTADGERCTTNGQ